MLGLIYVDETNQAWLQIRRFSNCQEKNGGQKNGLFLSWTEALNFTGLLWRFCLQPWEVLPMEMTLGCLVHAPDLPLSPAIHPHSCPVPCWHVSEFISLCLNRSFACLSQISPCLLNKLELSSGEQTKALNQLERVLLFKNLKVSLLLPLLSPFLFIYLNVYM